MRLITHNMLKCNVRGVENGYPLKIEPKTVDLIPADLDLDLTRKMLKRIQWHGLRSAALDLSLPGRINDIEDISALGDNIDEELLKEIHHLLFEIHVVEGDLICPESGRRFTVRDSIPNMLLHEDEV